MKKILFYIDMLDRTGAQRVMRNLVEFFFSKGYETVLVNDFPKKSDEHQFGVPNGVKRIFLKENNFGNPIIKNIERITKLRKIVKKERPDLVLSFLGRPNQRMLIATMGLKVKKVVSVRNDPYKEYGNTRLKKWFANRLFLKADGCVFQTEDAAKYFSKNINKKSRIIFNPVAEPFYKYERSNNPANVITVGRFEPQKNHKLLINAFSKICGEFPDERLVMYGCGPMMDEIKQYCTEKGLSDRVDMPGNVPNIGERLTSAKVFVLSSDYEGMPNALMEALAVGVPSISTDCPCGGPKTLINNETQGVLVPCRDVDKMAQAMRELLSDADRRKIISAAARQRAEVYRSDRIFRQWEDFFNMICG